MKRFCTLILALILCFGVVGCSQSQSASSTQSSAESNVPPVPDGYHSIIIGELETYIPNGWTLSRTEQGLDEYLYSGYHANEASLVVGQLSNKPEKMTASQFDAKVEKNLESNVKDGGHLTTLDTDDEGPVWTKYYSIISAEFKEHGCFLYYKQLAYLYKCKIDADVDLEDPVTLMSVYTHPIN